MKNTDWESQREQTLAAAKKVADAVSPHDRAVILAALKQADEEAQFIVNYHRPY